LNSNSEATPVIEVNENFTEVSLKNNFEYKVEDVASSDTLFRTIDKRNLVLGQLNKEVVLQTLVVNTAQVKRQLVVQIANSNLNHFVIQTYQGEHMLEIEEFGDHFKFHQRSYKHRNFIYHFEALPNDTLKIVIKVKPQKEAFYLPLTISSRAYFLKNSTKDQLILGGIIGMFSLYILIIFALYFATRNKLFLFYGLIDLCLLGYLIYDSGIGYQYIWFRWSFMQDLIVIVVGTGYVIGLISFGREFLSTRVKYPKYDLLFQVFIGIALISFLTILVLEFFTGAPLTIPILILNLLFVLFGFVISGLGIVTYMQSKRRQGFWFLILFMVQSIMWFFVLNQRMYWGIHLLSADSVIYNFLPVKTAIPHYLLFNFLVEIILVSAIIAYSFQDVLNEYNLSKKKMEEINQESIKSFIHGQEEERKLLSDQLDKKVGRSLVEIKQNIGKILEKSSVHERFESAFAQIQEVEEDLGRIASDYVVDWKSISLKRIVVRVMDQLKMAMPKMTIHLEMDDEADFGEVNDLVKLNLYRILQEICNNVIKHAQATKLSASFKMTDHHQLLVEITDNGVGFEYHDDILHKGIGLRNIDTRVKTLNGRLTIQPKQNEGTHIKIRIPIERIHSK
jgi:signal transduction histidine kinase